MIDGATPRAGSSSRARHGSATDPGASPGPLASAFRRPQFALAEGRPHGDRVRYLGGCRCAECRRANTEYEKQRYAARKAGDWNGIVDAGAARAHLVKLSRLGVGKRAVYAATDIAMTVLEDVRTGKKRRIRARTERKILAVTKACASDHALVPARRTWRLIQQLLEEGFTRTRLATELGSKARKPSLQLAGDFVLARTAHRVEVLHRRLTQ